MWWKSLKSIAWSEPRFWKVYFGGDLSFCRNVRENPAFISLDRSLCIFCICIDVKFENGKQICCCLNCQKCWPHGTVPSNHMHTIYQSMTMRNCHVTTKGQDKINPKEKKSRLMLFFLITNFLGNFPAISYSLMFSSFKVLKNYSSTCWNLNIGLFY